MKTIYMKSMFLLMGCILLGLISCDDNKDIDLTVGTVNTLYGPTDGKAIVLKSDASASQTFEWEPTRAMDGGAVLYDVLFDKEGGDFSAPIYTISSDGTGYKSTAEISHKILNKIAGLAGIGSGATGNIIWTVRASKGLKGNICAVHNKLAITRLTGLEELPTAVYLSGSATEATGSNKLSFCLAVGTKPGDTEAGVYEIYTKLSTGTYTITDNLNRTFSISSTGTIVEGGTTTITADQAGTYRIKLDFTVCNSTIDQITKVTLYSGNWQRNPNFNEYELTYRGSGVWKIDNLDTQWGMTSATGGSAGDSRYRYQVYTKASGNKFAWAIASKNSDNGNPTTYEGEYMYAFTFPYGYSDLGDWNYCYKLNNNDTGKLMDFGLELYQNSSHLNYIQTVTVH